MGIVDYLVSVGVPRNLASNWQRRKPLAQQYLGISDYTGTAAQNVALVQALQAAGYTYNGGGGGNGGGDTYPKNISGPTTKTYKGYSYVLHAQQESANAYAAYLKCDALSYLKSQYFNNANDAQSGLTTLEQQFKSYVDSQGGGTNPETPGSGTNWDGAAQNTTEYNGHAITIYFLKNGSTYSAKVTCSGPVVNDSQEQSGLSQQSAMNWARNIVNQYKSQIDSGGPETPTGNGTQILSQSELTEVYNGKTIRKSILQYGPSSYQIDCNCNEVGYSAPHGTATTESQARSILANYVQQAKTAIDGGGSGGGNGTAGDDAPWPEIVFGNAASVEGGAGPNYQIKRNRGIADMIYQAMQGQTFNSVDSVKRYFRDEVMSIVNSHGGNLQIDAQGRITGENKEAWANTVEIIKQYLFDKFGYTSWNNFVSGATPGGGGSGTNTSTGFTTGSGAADNTWGNIQEGTTYLFQWLDQRYNDSKDGRQALKNQVDDGYQSAINDRLNTLNNTFNDIKDQMSNASDLQQKAQRIYSNQNIEKMNQQLRQMGYDPGTAAPAVYYQATKQMANVAIEYYKLAAQEQQTLAELETQKAQLVDNIKAAGIEADQWTKNMLNELEKQIQNIRDNYMTQKNNILGTWTLQPMLDVMSNQFQADLQNIADMYQDQFVDTYPEMKLIAAARIFGSDWYYCDSSVAINYNAYSTFGEYLAACAQSIKTNKLRAETQVAQAGATIYGNTSSTNNSTTTTTPTPTTDYVYLT